MAGDGERGGNLLFILSQPRSGSTLLQRVLGAHSACMTTAEPWVLLQPLYALRPRGLQAEYSEVTAYRGLKGFLGVFDNGEDRYFAALRRMWSGLYAEAAATEGKRIFIDKTPRYYLIGGEIRRLFPEAVMVVLIRNPMAVLVSVLDTWVKGDWTVLANPALLRDLCEGPRRLQETVEKVPSAVRVRYEDFVEQPGVEAQRVCEELGIGFEPEMLEYGRHRKPAGELGDPVGVDREASPVGRPKDRWKERAAGSPVVAGLCRAYLQVLDADLLRKWGYSSEEIQEAVRAGERWWSCRLPWGLLLREPSTLAGKLLKPVMVRLAAFLEARSA